MGMRKLFILLVTAILFGWAGSASATITVTGRKAGHGNGGSGITSVTTITSQVSGNINICGVNWADDGINGTSTVGDTFTVTDGAGNTYNGASPDIRLNETASGRFTAFAVVHANNIAMSASNTITLTVTSINTVFYALISCSEWHSSLGSSLTKDQSGSADPGSAASPISIVAGGATATANELIYADVQLNGDTLVAGASYTLLNAPFANAADEYQLVSSIATYTATMTFGGTQTGAGVLVTFREPPIYASHTGGQLVSAPLLPQVTPSAVYPSTAAYPSYILTPVASGANLQTAINAAACGTKLNLAHDGTFTTGSAYTLPNNSCTCHTDATKFIIIQSDAFEANYVPGIRLDPSAQYHNLAHIFSTDGNYTFSANANGASCWGLAGLDITELTDGANSVVIIGNALLSIANYPHDNMLWWDYLHGQATKALGFGLQSNGNWWGIVDSYISDIHRVGQDATGILSYDGLGPALIQNNYVQGAAENFLFGGAVSQTGAIEADITAQKNHFFKPLNWYLGSPSYTGIHWQEKNLFEFKWGQRILATANVFQNSWSDAQIGVPLLFNPGCSGSAPANNSVWDVTYYYNILQNAPAVYNYGGCSDQVTQEPHRFLMHDNLYYQIDPTQTSSGGSYKDLLVNGGGYGAPAPPFNTYDIWHVHETFSSANIGVGYYSSGQIDYGMQFRDSILDTGSGGAFFANGGATGDAFVSTWQPGMNATYNCYYGSGGGVGSGSAFTGKQTVADQTAIFTTPGSDFHVKASSACYHAASDGKSMGADIDAVNAATAGVVQILANLHTVTNVSPSTFTHLGSTSITITGTNFISGEAQVIIGGAGPAVAEASNSCGFSSPGQFTVTVSTDTTHFTYTGGCVVVTSAPITLAVNDTINVTVNSAQTTGTVNRYTPGNLCTSLSVVNSTTITCTTPAATGTVTNGSVSVFECQFGICAQFNGANYN